MFDRILATVFGAVSGSMVGIGFGWPFLVVIGINFVIVAVIMVIFDATEARK